MLRTYLNENLNTPYPFMADEKLPFPLSAIAGLSLCVHLTSTSAVHPNLFISSVTISGTVIKASVSANTITGGSLVELPVGVFTCDAGAQNTYGAFVSYSSAFELSGFIKAGRLPSGAAGTYQGHFRLDPSCISFMYDSVYGTMDEITINQDVFPVGQLLWIDCSGLLTMLMTGNEGTLELSSESADITLNTFGGINEPSMVTSINRQKTYGSKKLVFVSGSTNVVLYMDRNETSKTITLTVHGTERFRNCYAGSDDARASVELGVDDDAD